VQLAEAARLDPQVLLYILKSPGFAPVRVTLEIVIAAAFPLVSVTTFWPPALPMATETQLRLVGETVTAARQLIAGRAQTAIPALSAKLSFLGSDAGWFATRIVLKNVTRFANAEAETQLDAERAYMAPPRNFTVRDRAKCELRNQQNVKIMQFCTSEGGPWSFTFLRLV